MGSSNHSQCNNTLHEEIRGGRDDVALEEWHVYLEEIGQSGELVWHAPTYETKIFCEKQKHNIFLSRSSSQPLHVDNLSHLVREANNQSRPNKYAINTIHKC